MNDTVTVAANNIADIVMNANLRCFFLTFSAHILAVSCNIILNLGWVEQEPQLNYISSKKISSARTAEVA